MEPSDAVVEAGCQGTMRVDVTTRGERAHSARSWMGLNAIHRAAGVLARLNDYQPRRPVIDGLEYREGLNAVGIVGGVAGNVLPDECRVSVNHRFAPDRTEAEAAAHLEEVFAGFEVVVSDSAPGAMPGLSVPAAADFVEAVGGVVNPKFGWTDVARFSELGIPAVNFGPGDPHLAHKQEEFVPLAVVASGRGGSMSASYDDRPDSRVQADGPLTASDLRRVRFSTALRGYRMSEVDALLDRISEELDTGREKGGD